MWERRSNFSALFPDPINTYGFYLLSSVKAHWHAEGLLRGLNLSRYVTACGARAFLYLLTDRFIALQGVLHKSTCSHFFFPFGKLTFGLALVIAPQIYTVGRPGAVPPKVGSGQSCWINSGLGEGCRDRFLVLSKCVTCITWNPQPTMRNTLLSVLGEELLGQLWRHQTKKNYENGLEEMMLIIALFIVLWGENLRATRIAPGLALQRGWPGRWVWGDLQHHNPFYRAMFSGFGLIQVRRETHPGFYTWFVPVICIEIPYFFLGLLLSSPSGMH